MHILLLLKEYAVGPKSSMDHCYATDEEDNLYQSTYCCVIFTDRF